MKDGRTYEIQAGQTGKIEDILQLLDRVNTDVKKADSIEKMMLALGMVGATAALATSLISKRKKIMNTALALGAGTAAAAKGISTIVDTVNKTERAADSVRDQLQRLMDRSGRDDHA